MLDQNSRDRADASASFAVSIQAFIPVADYSHLPVYRKLTTWILERDADLRDHRTGCCGGGSGKAKLPGQ